MPGCLLAGPYVLVRDRRSARVLQRARVTAGVVVGRSWVRLRFAVETLSTSCVSVCPCVPEYILVGALPCPTGPRCPSSSQALRY